VQKKEKCLPPILTLLLLASLTSGDALAARPNARTVCRAALHAVVDPLDVVFKGAETLFAKNWADVFDEARYQNYRKVYSLDPELLNDQVQSAEQFLARADALFDRIGYSDHVRATQRLPKNLQSRQFVSELNKILKSDKTATEANLRKLARLYYATTRKIPYHSVETLINLPTTSKTAFINYQAENLFLRMAFRDVLKDLGITSPAEVRNIRTRMRRALYTSLVTTVKLMSWTNGELLISRLSQSDAFWNEILSRGYETALRNQMPEIRSKLSGAANVEVFVAVAGGIYSVYSMYLLGQHYLAPAPVTPGTYSGSLSEEAENASPQAMRNEILARWEASQVYEYGTPSDPADRETIRQYYDTLSVDLLRQVYSDALKEQ